MERPYRADVDGLRAVAVSAVVAFHAFPSLLPGGFVGVDIFFVISGYLITGILLESVERGTFRFRNFYARRIRRIFPALALLLAVLLAFGCLALTPDEYRTLARHSSAAAGFALNFVLWRESGYFDVAGKLKPLLHLWSLAIEEQFYLVWPLVLYLCWRWRRGLIGVLAGIFAASFAANVVAARTSPDAAFFLPFARFWELAAGALLAEAERRGLLRLTRLQANAAAVIGAALIAVAFAVIREAAAFPGWWALLPTAGAVLLIAEGGNAWLSRALLTRPIAVGVGLISYPLYLWHWPLLSLAAMIGLGEVSHGLTLALVGLSVVLAWLTYHFVEKPIRFGRPRGVGRRLDWRTPSLVAAMCGLAAVAVFVSSEKGFPSRFPHTAATREHARSVRHQLTDPECERFVSQPRLALDYCRYQPGTSAEVVAVIGDSHARSLFPGLAEKLAVEGIGTLLLASAQCPPLLGTTIGALASERSECVRKTEQTLSVVQSRPGIGTVVIATRGPLYTTGSGFGDVDQRQARAGHLVAASGAGADPLATFRDGLRSTVETLMRSGKRVTYLLEVPELGFLPLPCLERPRWIRPARACEVTRHAVDARQSDYRAMVRELERSLPGFTVVDPFSLLCDGARCRAADGEVPLYEDDDHLSLEGSRLVATRLF